MFRSAAPGLFWSSARVALKSSRSATVGYRSPTDCSALPARCGWCTRARICRTATAAHPLIAGVNHLVIHAVRTVGLYLGAGAGAVSVSVAVAIAPAGATQTLSIGHAGVPLAATYLANQRRDCDRRAATDCVFDECQGDLIDQLEWLDHPDHGRRTRCRCGHRQGV